MTNQNIRIQKKREAWFIKKDHVSHHKVLQIFKKLKIYLTQHFYIFGAATSFDFSSHPQLATEREFRGGGKENIK